MAHHGPWCNAMSRTKFASLFRNRTTLNKEIVRSDQEPMAYRQHNPKPKHKVYDVAGPSGYEELAHRLVDILDDDDDPSTVLVMGHGDDMAEEGSAFYLKRRIKELWPDAEERQLARL